MNHLSSSLDPCVLWSTFELFSIFELTVRLCYCSPVVFFKGLQLLDRWLLSVGLLQSGFNMTVFRKLSHPYFLGSL